MCSLYEVRKPVVFHKYRKRIPVIFCAVYQLSVVCRIIISLYCYMQFIRDKERMHIVSHNYGKRIIFCAIYLFYITHSCANAAFCMHLLQASFAPFILRISMLMQQCFVCIYYKRHLMRLLYWEAPYAVLLVTAGGCKLFLYKKQRCRHPLSLTRLLSPLLLTKVCLASCLDNAAHCNWNSEIGTVFTARTPGTKPLTDSLFGSSSVYSEYVICGY